MGLFDRAKRAQVPLSPQPPVMDADEYRGQHGVVTVRCADGPTQDTIDQLLACREQGIVDLTVILDQDGVAGLDPEIVEVVEMEILDLVGRHGWTSEHVTVVRG